MKTIVLILIIAGISIYSSAQNEKGITKFQKKDFNDYGRKDTSGFFNISPQFKFDKELPDFKYSQRLNDPFQLSKTDSIHSSKNIPEYELRMPVAGSKFYSNMPIAVPDTSVHYYLRVKRIPFVNPLEGK